MLPLSFRENYDSPLSFTWRLQFTGYRKCSLSATTTDYGDHKTSRGQKCSSQEEFKKEGALPVQSENEADYTRGDTKQKFILLRNTDYYIETSLTTE